VKQLCAGVYTSVITAEFGAVDGEWDLDKCVFTIAPKPKGVYACLLSGVKINILDVAVTDSMAYSAGVTLNYLSRVRKFEDVLLYLAQQTCGEVNSIVSNFFQINPTSVSDINYVTGTENKITNLLCSALSDARNPEPTEAATKEFTTFKEFLADLRTLFDVYWTVDTNNNVVIEHFSYFNSVAGLDLTAASYDKYLSGTNRFSFLRRDSPKFETWFMNASDQSCELIYDNACGNKQLNEERISYATKTITTDFYNAVYSGNIAGNTPGILLLAAYPVGNAYDPLYNLLMGSFGQPLWSRQNEELVLHRLIQKYHRHGRPQLSAEIKYASTPGDYTDSYQEDFFIYSERPQKKQVEIKVPLCCDETFDSENYITTFMGNGVVDEAFHDLEENILSLNLKYKLNTDNADIEPNDLSGLQLWLKGDTGKTITSGKVTQWNDQSGNNYHAIQATTSVVNGWKPIQRFKPFRQSAAPCLLLLARKIRLPLPEGLTTTEP
jgi:hypothetical protein